MNYYIAALLVACVGPSVLSVNVQGVFAGFWAWVVIVYGIKLAFEYIIFYTQDEQPTVQP